MGHATCYLCKRKVDADDSFCYGCHEHICDVCHQNDPWGAHTPKDHT